MRGQRHGETLTLKPRMCRGSSERKRLLKKMEIMDRVKGQCDLKENVLFFCHLLIKNRKRGMKEESLLFSGGFSVYTVKYSVSLYSSLCSETVRQSMS